MITTFIATIRLHCQQCYMPAIAIDVLCDLYVGHKLIPAKMAEQTEMSFGGTFAHVHRTMLDSATQWRHLANMTERSVRGCYAGCGHQYFSNLLLQTSL